MLSFRTLLASPSHPFSFSPPSHHPNLLSPTQPKEKIDLITSFFGSLPRYHWRMASIVSQIVVVLMNRELSEEPVNWPHVSRRNRQNS